MAERIEVKPQSIIRHYIQVREEQSYEGYQAYLSRLRCHRLRWQYQQERQKHHPSPRGDLESDSITAGLLLIWRVTSTACEWKVINMEGCTASHTRKVIVVPKIVWGWFTRGRWAFLGSLLASAGDIVMLVEEVAQRCCMAHSMLRKDDNSSQSRKGMSEVLRIVCVVRCTPGVYHYSPKGTSVSR